ncbi:hypothetical protein BDV25DRAFT_165708 [Aspergillus avenaceus]|uniref:COP9 signalosome complex subunit 3 N-terminal helical repeats domain-containing protein n=1 Tax=Aspergillus avenaceus TaxID=36643 RepID=A0A5N6TEZ8_ASPAV|nr:hypothetical protein BDV25DRAFT_165708 [Aspergillus avenaceus]
MEELLSPLTSVSRRLHTSDPSDEDYDKQIRDLIIFLKDPGRASDISAVSGYALDKLDPSSHSLSYLFLLLHQINSTQFENKDLRPFDPTGALWPKIVRFLTSFDPFQIRYAGHEWRQLVELTVQSAQAVSKPLLAVPVIRDAILRLDPSSGVLTSIHITFIKLCLMSRSYSYALPILEKQICHFPTATSQTYQKHHKSILCGELEPSITFVTDSSGFSTKLTYRDYLQYFFCGAMIYMALKKWDKALHHLNIVICSPVTNAVSKIMVEGYKKWILVSLLACGKPIPSQSITSSHVMKVYQSLAQPYTTLADAFGKCDLQRLKVEVEAALSVWRMDNNTGLVYQVVDAFQKRTTLKLGKTFSALAVADVARHLPGRLSSLREVESFVASLVMCGTLDAVLLHLRDYSDSTMLRFSGTAKSRFLQENNVQGRILQECQSLRAMGKAVRDVNRGLELSNENFLFLQKCLKWSDNSGKGGINALEQTEGGFDLDEDIMGDIH